MPSPFDKVTESQELRNYLENRPVVEELARSQDVVFQSEMNRLGLEEKQKEISINDENRAIRESFDEKVTSQSSSPEDLMKRTQDFLKENPRSSAAIMEYAGKASTFFEMGNKSKLSGIELERAVRENETQKKFQALNEKSIQANLEASTLKSTQDMQTAKIEEYKQNESKLDGISGMFASVSGIGVNSVTKKAINVINDSYYRQIDEALSRNDTQGKIDAQRFFDEATKTFGPLLEFDAVNKTLRNAASVKHAETMVKSSSIYQPEYREWVDRKTAEGLDAASVTFDKFLIDCYNEKDEAESTGNRMMRDNKQAEMLEDFGELAEAKKQFTEYDEALLASIDPVTGLPDRSKMGSLNREAAKMRNLLKQAMDRRKIKADATSQQLEQEKVRLDNLQAEADLRNTESLIKARDEGRIDVNDPELQSLQSEKSAILRSIRQEESKKAERNGATEARTKLIEKLEKQVEVLNTEITNRRNAITPKSNATNSVNPAE
jgi:hypothetical protein